MQRFKNILAVVEITQSSSLALERAVSLAESNQASLTVISVIPQLPSEISKTEAVSLATEFQKYAVNEQHKKLEALVLPYRKQLEIKLNILVGTPFLEIVKEVLRNGRDLVIKMSEDPDWLDRLFGSNDMHLLRKCPCPVWIIKSQEAQSYKRILAAVDVDDGYLPDDLEAEKALNRQILEMAGSMALADSADLHIVHVWDAVDEELFSAFSMEHVDEDKINRYAEANRRRHTDNLNALIDYVEREGLGEALKYLKPRKHLLRGSARKEIPLLAKSINADLIVMGTVARTGISGFFIGNTAETILSQIDCSVLAIKPPGFVTPVTLEK
jgi:nucleotide-binding universal stress UspA family protein